MLHYITHQNFNNDGHTNFDMMTKPIPIITFYRNPPDTHRNTWNHYTLYINIFNSIHENNTHTTKWRCIRCYLNQIKSLTSLISTRDTLTFIAAQLTLKKNHKMYVHIYLKGLTKNGNATNYNRLTIQIILLQIQLVRGHELCLALLFETTELHFSLDITN